MALAVLIVSTEGGVNSLTTISASEQEAAEALIAVKGKGKFLGIQTENAVKFMARAWQVMGQHWEELPPTGRKEK